MLSQRTIKTGWHLLLASLAVAELASAKTTIRKLLLGACAGWHATAAWVDLTDDDEENDGDPT